MEDFKMEKTTEMMIAKAYEDGVKAGIKQLADHIQHQSSIGKPVEINGELYWLTDSRQHLIDIMDGIESAWNEESGEHKFIVPMMGLEE